MPAETILVVDDNTFVLSTISALLRHAEFKVLPAGSPREALHLGVTYQDPIHVILTDVILPDMDGPELACEFCKLHPEARPLFMTGLPDTPEVVEKILIPGLALLLKPFPPQALLEKLREVLAAPRVRSMGAQ